MTRDVRAALAALFEKRFQLSMQLYAAIGGAVVLTVTASLIGWFSFNRVGDAQSRVNERSVPELAAAFGAAQHSSTLVAAAPRLTAAAGSGELAQVSAGIDEAHRALQARAAELGAAQPSGAGGGPAERIRAHEESLIRSIEAIEEDMAELFALTMQKEALRIELAALRAALDNVLIAAVDDQLFYTISGYRELGAPPAPRAEHFSEEEFSRYRHLAELQADANTAIQLLESAFVISAAPLIEPLRERFEAARGRIERNLAALASSPVHAAVGPSLASLFALGIGDGDGFDLIERELRLLERQRALLDQNSAVAAALLAEMDSIVSAAQAGAQEATAQSNQAMFVGRTLLLAISAVSVGGALLIAWLFVGRVLLRRLQLMSDWMRRMAAGNLEATAEIGGRDEIAEMGAALEVFRQRSLEAQRLNLVERLAEELQGKNEELERVLAELQRAQDQIVMREKLAALGELTSGVAHEIRNPLNFVKNFSEVSEELLTEMGEVLEEAGGQIGAEQRGLIDEISADLTGNLGRIRAHSERANRIVHDMLMMGRGSGERRSAEINRLLDEYAGLAYHSARAADADFNLDLRREFDPDAGELDVVPEELGRVFLNIVGNACYATDQKRRAIAAGGGGEPYMPTLTLRTRRSGGQLEIGIRDNGGGIPPDVVDSIFNPFFTTKPPGEGTGLGLAMCSDIVREHGGAIRVETEPGEFTEMIVALPLAAPAEPERERADTAEAAAPGRG